MVNNDDFLDSEKKNSGLEIINQSNLVPRNILEPFFTLLANCISFKGLITFHLGFGISFHFQNVVLFSKCAFIFKNHGIA